MDKLLYIFDCDGTLTTTKSGATFRKQADDWQLLPRRAEKLKVLKMQGARLAMATNQGGVAFGFMPQEDIMLELHKTAKALNIPPGGVYICYSHPKASIAQYRLEDHRRKPGPGMLLEAMSDFECGLEETVFVGDMDDDKGAAEAAGVEFMWAEEFFGNNLPTSISGEDE